MKDRGTQWWIGLIVVLALGLAVLDFQLPLGVAVWLPYVVVVLMSLWLPNRRYTYITAGLCSALTLAGLCFSPPGGAFWMAATNRLLAVLAFWVAAFVGLAARRARELEKANRALQEEMAQRKKLESQFLRTQRLESIGILASGIAHDFNNLLTPILMSVKLLKEDRTEDERRPLLDTLQASAERGADMVKQLLSFSGGTDSLRITVQLEHVIKEIASLIEHTFPRGIQFQSITPTDLYPVRADATQLSQVLLNLCVNARDAMPMGGTLILRADNVEMSERDIQAYSEARPGLFVRVLIEDTGCGMPIEVLDKAFDPFFTTKGPGKGTGLGLSTVLGIVRSHGGFIQLESEKDQGSRFSVFLPAQTDAIVDPKKNGLARRREANGELVLFVDDEPLIVQAGKTTLERHGYRVVTASDGGEAIALFKKLRSEIAIIVLDMMMPGVDGPTALTAIRAIDPDIRVVVSSGLRVPAPVADVIAAGRSAFLPKPYSDEQLLMTIANLLE